jgi:Major Facilitator Superfamily
VELGRRGRKRNLRFTAASGSITTAFFALGGFTFLITQYFQFLKGYSPFSTGLRVLPVAIALVVGSITGVKLSVRIGNKVIVAAGLTMVGIGFAWVSTASTATPYLEIVGQMIVIGIGMGFTTAPATEAIMGVVSKEKAGIGSAVNDATRELGTTLGVAVIGSIFASLYASGVDAAPASIPPSAVHSARDSIGAAIAISPQLGPAGNSLLDAARSAFFDGFQVGCLVAAGVLFIGAAFIARFLPARPEPPLDLSDLEHELALEPLTTTPNHEHDSGMVHPSND